ncbi:MAG: peptidylprolyl isomerase [Candidatus Levybacteria bacterium]|nr:peptidylprolyl isomerase [Candidatus Levybacteria bacterium]
MINNNITKQNPAVEETLNVAPLTPSPSPVQTVNLTPSPTSSQTMQNSQTNANTAIIKTSKGDIELSLYVTDAPNTVSNFIQKAKSGFYNNLIFHRVEDWVIQGGDPDGNGTGGGNVPVEFNSKPFMNILTLVL